MQYERARSYWKDESNWGLAGSNPLRPSEEYLIEKWILRAASEKIDEIKVLSGGCASGRIELAMERMGISHIEAFDFVPEFIDIAKANAEKSDSKVSFFVGDMKDISMVPTESIDYVVYLNRMFCFLHGAEIDIAIKEVSRTLKKDGVLLADLLIYDRRWINRFLSAILSLAWILQGKRLPPRTLPRMKNKDGKPNLRFFSTKQNLLYWFTRAEIIARLEQSGLQVIEIKDENDEIGTGIVCKKIPITGE